jgi:hypothetical protein
LPGNPIGALHAALLCQTISERDLRLSHMALGTLTLIPVLPTVEVTKSQEPYDVAKVYLYGFKRMLTRPYILLISKELVCARRSRKMRNIV